MPYTSNGGVLFYAKNCMKVKINKINVDAYDTMLKLLEKI